MRERIKKLSAIIAKYRELNKPKVFILADGSKFETKLPEGALLPTRETQRAQTLSLWPFATGSMKGLRPVVLSFLRFLMNVLTRRNCFDIRCFS